MRSGGGGVAGGRGEGGLKGGCVGSKGLVGVFEEGV